MDYLLPYRCGVKYPLKLLLTDETVEVQMQGSGTEGMGRSSSDQIVSSSSVDSWGIISSFLFVLSNFPISRLRLWYETCGRVEEVAIQGESKNPVYFIHLYF